MESTSPASATIRERVRWNQDIVDVLVAVGLFVAVATVISSLIGILPTHEMARFRVVRRRRSWS